MSLHNPDPKDSKAVIRAQRAELQMLQEINPKIPIRIKILEGETPEGGDSDLYRWLPHPNIWNKVKQPIFTRGILLNEILIDPDTTDWQEMKAGVEKLCDYCQKNNIPVQMGFSGGKGVHCSIIIGNIPFDDDLIKKIKEADIDVYKNVRRALFFAFMEKAGVKPDDIKVDMAKINFNAESKGSQVRTFGTTRAPGLYKTLIEKIPDHKPEPYELPLIFPEKVEIWEIEPGSEFYQIVIDALEKEVERAKKANEYPLTDIDFSGSEIMEFPCIKTLYEAGLEHGRYYAGEAVLLMCKKCGFSKEEAEKHMRELYRTFPTISQKDTDQYIDNALSMYETKNFSCRALKELFPDRKLCDFLSCPIKEKVNGQKEKALSEKLKKIKTPDNKSDCIKAAKKFIAENLMDLPLNDVECFIFVEFKEHFEFTDKELSILFKDFKAKKAEKEKKEAEALENELKNEDKARDIRYNARVNAYPEEIRELAEKVLREADAFEFILDTWNMRHVGDRNIGENCLCSVGSTYILNTRGLHVKPSGESGKGKSDAIETFLELLPEHKYISGSMSSKTLYYYRDLESGTIIYSDDAHFTPDMIDTLKQSTSSFQKTSTHRTVIKQEFSSLSIPARSAFLFSTVDGIEDEQLANRFLNADVDGSREQDRRVYNHIKESELDLSLDSDDDVLICQCIFDILGKELYKIKIPFINAIDWTNIENRRNFPKFLDILRSVTLFNVLQRQKVNGYYLSEIEDFYRAVSIYKGTSKNNATNLTDTELTFRKFLAEKGQATVKELMKKFNKSRTRINIILQGRDGNGGMLAKVPQLDKVYNPITREIVFEYNGDPLGLEIYDNVARLDEEKAKEEITKFKERLSESSVTSVTHVSPMCHPHKVTLKSNTIDRINSSVPSKKEILRKKEIESNKQSELTCSEKVSKLQNFPSGVSQGDRGDTSPKMSQPAAKTYVTPLGDTRVTVGDSGVSGDTPPIDLNKVAQIGLLKKAITNYAKKNNKTSKFDVNELVNNFSGDVPEYERCLGKEIILQEATKLKKFGVI